MRTRPREKIPRKTRYAWVHEGKCFSCGRVREPQLIWHSKLCLHHTIRLGLRKRGIFFTKPVYQSTASRVLRERRKKRPHIINYLRYRYIAVHEGRLKPFVHIREALVYIDEMWQTLGLHHSFVFRSFRLGELIRYLFHLDHLATKGWPRKGWVGDKTNMRWAKERADGLDQDQAL